MTIDLGAAADFLTMNGRMLERRRFELLLGREGPESALVALDAYRNPDGGYGWGIEPDLRAAESQPAGALHAFEVFEECGTAAGSRPAELCDWLSRVSLPDGGLPFALPVAVAAGCAPFWVHADPMSSSLHITSAVAGAAHRVGASDPAVATHPWLAAATRLCLERLDARTERLSTLELLYVLGLLDAVPAAEPRAATHLARLAATVPASGAMHVEGGAPDEMIHAIQFSPMPGRPVRGYFDAAVISADLDRLTAGQREHGGWEVDFGSFSPAAALEWNAYVTVNAVKSLRANGRA